MTTWNARWPTIKRGHSYHGRPANSIHPLLQNHPSRKLVSTVIQMRTGHGYNRQYLARIPTSNIESPICTCGYRRQSPQHLLLDCKYYKTARRGMKQKIKPLPLTRHMAMHTGKGLQEVLEFLDTTGVGSRTWILGPRKVLVGGFGWSHIRDDSANGEEEDDGQRRRGIDVAEAAGVG